MDWTYYTFLPIEPKNFEASALGYLFDEDNHRVKFDGIARTSAEWETYLETNDERGSIR